MAVIQGDGDILERVPEHDIFKVEQIKFAPVDMHIPIMQVSVNKDQVLFIRKQPIENMFVEYRTRFTDILNFESIKVM